MIRERTKIGLARARAEDRVGGPRFKLSPAQQQAAVEMMSAGDKTQSEVAKLFNVDRSTISRLMSELRETALVAYLQPKGLPHPAFRDPPPG